MTDTDTGPVLQPTGTDLGAAVRHLLDTGDLSGVPWILDTLYETGTPEAIAVAVSFRSMIGKMASKLGPDRPGWTSFFEQRAAWPHFREAVEALFWFDLYTLESTLVYASPVVQRSKAINS